MKKKIFYAENTDVYPGITARNNAVLEYEKFIHRTYFPYIIHPYSHFRVTWEKFSIVIIPLRLFVVSLLWATFPHQVIVLQGPILFFQFLNFIDVVTNFFTGYIESDSEKAVLEPRRIVKKYLMTYFILDVLPCIPIEVIFIALELHKKLERAEIIMHILNHVLYLRYFCYLRYVRNLSKIMLWNVFLVGLISVSLGTSFIIIIANNVYHMMCVSDFKNPSRHGDPECSLFPNSLKSIWGDTSNYFNDLAFLIFDCLFFESRISDAYISIRSVVLMCCFFSNILFVTFFIKYIMLKMMPKEKFLNLESRILTFVRMRHLPRTIEYKTLLYFQIVLENKAYREDEIFNYIPDTFKADIFFHLCLPLLKHFYAFEDLPTYILRRLAECMRYQLYLPNEMVLRKDEHKLSMFFVHRGTVALYSSKHVELYHFEGGSSFNGRNFILGDSAMGHYAISIEVSEVYRLYVEDFVEIMNAYPHFYAGVKQKILQDKTGGSYAIH